MKFSPSLKIRIAAIVLALFFATLWGTASFTAHVLKRNMEQLLVDQQVSTASYVAKQVDGDIVVRLQSLENIAKRIEPALLADPANLDRFLAERTLLSGMFTGGVFVTDERGTAVADNPKVPNRVGTNYIDRMHVKSVLATGRPYIGKPVMGKTLLVPILPIAVPILDRNGRTIGALVGVSHLETLGFLGEMTGQHYGRTGAYFLISPRDGMYISGTDKALSLRSLPSPGTNPMWDRFAEGNPGSGITHSEDGEEMLMSAASLPQTGWMAVVSLPTREAFKPVTDMVRLVYLVALVSTVLVALAVWLALRRLLAPLDAAASELHRMATGEAELRPVEIRREDEIGHLLASFNALENRLSELLELNAKIFSSANVGINAFHADGHCVAANEAMARIVGAQTAQMLRQNFRDLRSWQESGLLAAAEHVLSSGLDRHLEIHTVTSYGKEIWMDCSMSCFHSKGDPHIMLVAHDVSARKQLEIALAQRERQQAAVAEIGRLALTDIDLDALFDNACAILTRTLDVEYGKVLQLMPDGKAFLLRAGVGWQPGLVGKATVGAGMDSQAGYTLACGQPVVVDDLALETRFSGPPLLVQHHVVSGLSTVIPGGDRPFGVLGAHTASRRGFSHDELAFVQLVANLLATAVERKQTEKTLRESEERFRTVADYTYGWEYWQGPNEEMVYVSPYCERVTGFAPEEFIADPNLVYRIIYKDDQPLMESHLRDISYEDAATVDFRIQRKDGEIRWIAHGCRAVFGADGRFLGRRTSNRDITDLKQVEARLRDVNETLEQRVAAEVSRNIEQERMLVLQSRHAAMGEMIGNIAHQWRQPLSVLGILLVNLQDSYLSKELNEEEMEKFVMQGRRLIAKMSDTIDDFRNFFRPAREKVAFGLKKVLEDTLALLGAGLKNHNISLKLDCPGEVMAFGLANEYSQVIMNLLNNAKDAILANKRRDGEIYVRIAGENGVASVTIRDNGGGMPDEVMERVFEPYFTTREQGTGIGLYMSKLIVEGNMGGRIEARNVDGGAEFTVRCPQFESPKA